LYKKFIPTSKFDQKMRLNLLLKKFDLKFIAPNKQYVVLAHVHPFLGWRKYLYFCLTSTFVWKHFGDFARQFLGKNRAAPRFRSEKFACLHHTLVDFINILRVHFAPIFWCQKSARKMLMKLTPCFCQNKRCRS